MMEKTLNNTRTNNHTNIKCVERFIDLFISYDKSKFQSEYGIYGTY